ncbi:MAG: hybrid sensor histidine kinase/response regulator [Candidatus Binatia bacterium]
MSGQSTREPGLFRREAGGQSRSRESRRADRSELADFVDSISDGFFVLDRNWRLTYANAATAGLAGRAAHEIIGKSIWDVFPDLEAGEFREQLIKASRDRCDVRFEVRYPTNEAWCGVSIYPSHRGLAVYVQDITDRKHAELSKLEALRSTAEGADQGKDEFLAVLSHELRSPLNAVMMWSRLLQNGTLSPEKIEKAVDAITRSVELQVRLIDDLLDISRIRSGKLVLQQKPVDLGAIVTAALALARLAVDQKQLSLKVHMEPAFMRVRGDPVRLQQVIGNLLSNAIKFTPAGGQIQIELRRSNGEAEIAVRDSGCGIAPEALPLIFDRFHQADGSITRKHGGLGLGLTIARHLVERHHGTLDAESAGENQGATFRVRLPLDFAAADPTPRRPPERASRPSRALSGVKILLVDDEPEARDAAEAVLADAGAEVTTVGSAREAVARFEAKRPDVVVTDLAMPEEDGYALLRSIRNLERDAVGRIPVIALTALAGADDRARVIAAGFDAHLSKPLEPKDLVAWVGITLRGSFAFGH